MKLDYNNPEHASKCIKRLNIIMYVLIACIIIYVGIISYSYRSSFNIINKSNRINTVNTEFEVGDIISVKYFNVYGVIQSKSKLDTNYYTILYLNSKDEFYNFDIPQTFIEKIPTNSIIYFLNDL